MAKKRDNTPPRQDRLQAAIQEFMATAPHKIFSVKQIAAAVGYPDADGRDYVAQLLDRMARQGLVSGGDKGRYRARPNRRIVEGTITIPRKGPATLTTPEGEIFSVPYSNLNHALHNDTVRACLYPSTRDVVSEAEVIEIVKRARDQFVGVIDMQPNFAFLVPDSATLPVDIFIPRDECQRSGVRDGQKIVVRIKAWPENAHNPVGEIVKVLGDPGRNEVEMHAILCEYGLPYEFPAAVERDARQLDGGVSSDELARRRDFRPVTTFTIDPADAKDFDDAISLRPAGGGGWEVGVHIADVSHYIEPGSRLDKEAYARGTSVYLVDRVVPMLPENLSNGVCSLSPGADKLTYSAVFVLDPDANVTSYWLGRTVIRSDRRFSYEEAQERLESGQGDYAAELATCDALAQKLRARRFEHGSINFERDEIKFRLDDQGRPVDVYRRENNRSHQLIEELMLLANRTVARHVAVELAGGGKAKAFVYRVHDKPNSEKIDRFADFVRQFGQRLDTGDASALSASINALVRAAKGQAWQNVVETLAIRSMARAEYSAKNIGHYGLAFPHYSHFTSPIRRYPDLMTHRLLTRYLEGGRSAQAPALEADCKHCNEREALATTAERASIKYKQVEYLQERRGDEYDGVISGVTNWGLFVELDESGCEGLVSMQKLMDDYYTFDQDNFRVVGQHHRHCFALGDRVRVRVAHTDLLKKQIDFDMVRSYADPKWKNTESKQWRPARPADPGSPYARQPKAAKKGGGKKRGPAAGKAAAGKKGRPKAGRADKRR